jgi:hypothetical protein
MNQYVNQDLSWGYVENVGALVKTGVGAAGSEPGTGTTLAPLKNTGGSSEVSYWGSNNLFPQEVVADVEVNTSLPTTLNWKAKAWYGGGLTYGLVELDEQGNETFRRVRLPEVEQFLRDNDLARYAFETYQNLSYFANAWVELILSRNRQKIVHIAALDSCYVRWAKAQSAKQVMQHIYHNANWANGGRYDDEYCTKIPVLEVYYRKVDALRERTDGFKYAYPLNIPSPDKSEYQTPDWNSFRRSGWAEVAKAVVEFKKMLLKQILSVEWVIEVNPEYWKWKYKEWDEKTDDERRQLIGAELKNFGDVMTGSNGAGKSLLTTTVKNSKGEDVPAFKVTALDKKMKEGLFNEDSQEAASHVYTAAGVAPTLMGISPGKNMAGAGSGSDARVAFNNFISTSTFEQDQVTSVLHFIRDFNNWPENLEFRFKQPLIMTLDKGKQTQQQTA